MTKDTPCRLRRLNTVFRNRLSERVIVFITMCTTDRKSLLADGMTHRAFRLFCEESPGIADVIVGKYVLMPDHIHVFVSTYGSRSLSRWAGSLKKYLAKHWRERGVSGPYWQSSFFDHVLRKHESYLEKMQYVLDNPVRKGLIEPSGNWPFSGEISELPW